MRLNNSASGIILGIFCATFAAVAHARWNGPPTPYSAWFRAQTDARGNVCCAEGDGHEYDGDYTLNPDGSVTLNTPHVMEDGKVDKERTLPAYMVIKGPNPTGHAIWWYTETTFKRGLTGEPGTTHTDYCFAPGELG